MTRFDISSLELIARLIAVGKRRKDNVLFATLLLKDDIEYREVKAQVDKLLATPFVVFEGAGRTEVGVPFLLRVEAFPVVRKIFVALNSDAVLSLQQSTVVRQESTTKEQVEPRKIPTVIDKNEALSPASLVGETIAKGVKFVCECRGISIAKIAKDAGMSAGHLGNIFRGKFVPSWLTITKLSSALNLADGDLFAVGNAVSDLEDKVRSLPRLQS